MKNRRFGEYTISDQTPKEGDKVICVQSGNFNLGTIEKVTKLQEELNLVDTDNWKVIVDSKHEINFDDLQKFKEEHEVVYASDSVKGVIKKLVLTLAGGYKVYNNGEVVLETMHPNFAIKKYNLI